MRVKKLLIEPSEIVIVDDIITRGSTLLGAANRLVEAFPNAKIRGFAAMRSISRPTDFTGVIDPCVGKIHMSNGNPYRNP